MCTTECKYILQSTIQSRKHTSYVFNSVEDIPGFVVKTLKKCVVCLDCMKIMECFLIANKKIVWKFDQNVTVRDKFV